MRCQITKSIPSVSSHSQICGRDACLIIKHTKNTKGTRMCCPCYVEWKTNPKRYNPNYLVKQIK